MRCPTEMLLGRHPRYVQGSVGHTVKGHESAANVQDFLGFWSTGRTGIFPFVNSKNWCYQSVDGSSVHCASVLLEGKNPSGEGEWTNIHAVCIRKLQPWPKLGKVLLTVLTPPQMELWISETVKKNQEEKNQEVVKKYLGSQ